MKSFLEEKIDGDFDQISDFIDEFSQSISISKKKTKKPSYYNDWVGNFIKEYKQGVENEEVSNTEYMKLGSAAWQKFKESDDFLKEKSKWEKKNSNKIETKQSKSTKSTKSKKSKKSTKKSNDSDNDSTDDDINITNINTSDDSDSD